MRLRHSQGDGERGKVSFSDQPRFSQFCVVCRRAIGGSPDLRQQRQSLADQRLIGAGARHDHTLLHRQYGFIDLAEPKETASARQPSERLDRAFIGAPRLLDDRIRPGKSSGVGRSQQLVANLLGAGVQHK